MGFAEVMKQLEAWGSENTRRLYAKMGAGENQFGVTLGNLRALAKKLKTRHELAVALWSTGNVDAMILATMLMNPGQSSAAEIQALLKPIRFFRLVDELVSNVVARSAHAEALRTVSMDSADEWVGRAGWLLLSKRISEGQAEGLEVEGLLKRIESEILAEPKKKQELTNRCLVEIAVHLPAWTRRCIKLGERLGRFDATPVRKGCVSTYASEWIAAALKRKAARLHVGC